MLENQENQQEQDEEFKPDWKSPPYDTLKDYLDERGLESHHVKYMLGMGNAALARFRKGELKIDNELASKLSWYIGGTMKFWLERQRQYDEN